MEEARKIYSKKNDIILVVSDTQSLGRGRLNNNWISELGNIFFTLKLLPKKKLNKYFELAIISALEIKRTFNYFDINNVLFKWPNDIYIEKGKIGGILIESYTNNGINYCLLGIGINLVSSPNIKKYQTTYIKKYKKSILRNELTELLIKNILKSYYKWNQNIKIEIMKTYKKSLMYIGKEIVVNINKDQSIRGKFTDITSDGYLIISKKNNSKIIMSGSMELINDSS